MKIGELADLDEQLADDGVAGREGLGRHADVDVAQRLGPDEEGDGRSVLSRHAHRLRPEQRLALELVRFRARLHKVEVADVLQRHLGAHFFAHVVEDDGLPVRIGQQQHLFTFGWWRRFHRQPVEDTHHIDTTTARRLALAPEGR